MKDRKRFWAILLAGTMAVIGLTGCMPVEPVPGGTNQNPVSKSSENGEKDRKSVV